MRTDFKKMSPRARALTQLGGIVAGGIMLVAGGSIAINSLKAVNSYMVEKNPAIYMESVAEYIEENPEETKYYQAELSDLVRSANSAPGLMYEDRLYLFESNSSMVEPASGADICTSNVVSRLDEEARLEYVISTVDSTESRHYFRIVGEMLKNVGEDAYNSIADLFRK